MERCFDGSWLGDDIAIRIATSGAELEALMLIEFG
jgi:hypothetical protein